MVLIARLFPSPPFPLPFLHRILIFQRGESRNGRWGGHELTTKPKDALMLQPQSDMFIVCISYVLLVIHSRLSKVPLRMKSQGRIVESLSSGRDASTSSSPFLPWGICCTFFSSPSFACGQSEGQKPKHEGWGGISKGQCGRLGLTLKAMLWGGRRASKGCSSLQAGCLP